MAGDAPGVYQYSFQADIDLSDPNNNVFMAVAVGPAQHITTQGQGNPAIVAYAAGQNFIGLTQQPGLQGDGICVMLQGISRCMALGTWATGDALSVGAGGKLQKAGSSDTIFAIALESAVAGDISTCLLK